MGNALPIVRIHDDFWTPILDRTRITTLPDILDKFESVGAFANFDRVAAGDIGNHSGEPWFDGLIGETIRAASDLLAAEYDERLDTRLDGYIDRIAAAQETVGDGYINTYVTIMCPEKRWGAHGGNQLYHHELYNAGCLMEAAAHHYRATAKKTLLTVALRFANYIHDTIGPQSGRNVVPAHSLPEEAFANLYRLLSDESVLADLQPEIDPLRYLELAKWWIDRRGNHVGRVSFTEYAQDHRPVVQQDEAVGHAVRATLLYAGLAAVGRESRDESYVAAAERLWGDVVERKLYITGGVGPTHTYEGFSYGYDLPNSGYIETCAGVGMAMWASEMGRSFTDARYHDRLERVLFNNILGGVSYQGDRYSYMNPLRSDGSLHRWEWHGCPCCPPMLLKALSSLPEWIFACSSDEVYVHHYVGSTVTVPCPTGTFELVQETDYPRSGAVHLAVSTTETRNLAIHLRIPEWCRDFQIRVNDVPIDRPFDGGRYARLDREWTDGDAISLNMAMPVERIAAHPYVRDLHDKVALQRGPLVYCFEGVDNGDNPDIALPATPRFETEFVPGLLGGVVVIRGVSRDGQKITALPYYAWDNRDAKESSQDWLRVWVAQEGIRDTGLYDEREPLHGWDHLLYRPLPPLTEH